MKAVVTCNLILINICRICPLQNNQNQFSNSADAPNMGNARSFFSSGILPYLSLAFNLTLPACPKQYLCHVATDGNEATSMASVALAMTAAREFCRGSQNETCLRELVEFIDRDVQLARDCDEIKCSE
jgi:hypothetical protein